MTTVGQAYHGSLRRFPRFAVTPVHRATVAPTARLGTFCVEDPRIAAHFTLRPHVISAGYRHADGSRILRDDPWSLDEDPFLPGASVACVSVTLTNPKLMSVNEWLTLMGGLNRAPHLTPTVLDHWRQKGHDGLRIEAWRERAPMAFAGRPSVETDAVTWVAFDPQALVITDWMDATDAWTG